MNQSACSCWRCWFQAHFTVILLFSIWIIGLLATVVLMHEQIIEDKYVTWLEETEGGILLALTTALNAPNRQTSHPAEPAAKIEQKLPENIG